MADSLLQHVAASVDGVFRSGCSSAAVEVAMRYILDGVLHDTADEDPLTAEDWLEMARESINAIREPAVGKRMLLHRLTAAAAELGEAVKDTGDVGLQARELQKLVYHAAEQAQALREDDKNGINSIRGFILAAVQRHAL